MIKTGLSLAAAVLASSLASTGFAETIENNGPVTLIDLKESKIRVNEQYYQLPNRVQVGSMPAIYQLREGSVISFLAEPGSPYPTITSIGMLYQPVIQTQTKSANVHEEKQ